MKYGIDNLDEDNSKMENTMIRQAAAVEDDNGFYVVPNDFTDSDSDIEVIEFEPEPASSEYNSPTQYEPSVFFEGVLDTYPIDSHIIAKLKFNDEFKKSPGDRVLLLPLGWGSLAQAVSTGLIKNNHVIFDSQNLPKKLNEFYQLCYSSADQTVPGVSDTFSFQDITGHERMVSQLGSSSSRVSYIMNSLWTSLVVESDESTDILASEEHLPGDLTASAIVNSIKMREELGSTSTSEENMEKKELESELQVQAVQAITVLMEKQEINDTIPNEGNSSDDKSAEIQELTVMKKLIEKMEECDSLKNQVTKLESELTKTHNFVEYMITQKDERMERLSSDERNAHKYVYNTFKSTFDHPNVGHYLKQEKVELQMSYENELRALKRTYEEKIKALKHAKGKEIDELKRSHQKDIEDLQQCHKQAMECFKNSFEEKLQGYASQLVYAKYQQDILEKNLKEMKEDYDAQLKCCAKEYIKLKKINEKTANMNPNPSTSNSSSYLFSDLRDKVRSIKRRSKKEDSK